MNEKQQTTGLAAESNEFDVYHDRGHAAYNSGRPEEAIDHFTQAIRIRPHDTHLRIMRAETYERIGRRDSAIADLEAALAISPTDRALRELLAELCHERVIYVIPGQELAPDPQRKVMLARRAAELAPDIATYVRTLGIAQYGARQYGDAIATWERCLANYPGWYGGRNFFYLAMGYHRLGDTARARSYFDRGDRAIVEEDSRADPHVVPLTGLRATAAEVLASPPGELPADVFAAPG